MIDQLQEWAAERGCRLAWESQSAPAETKLLLSDKSIGNDRAETGIRMKLAWLGQPCLEPVLSRNLRALRQSRFHGD